MFDVSSANKVFCLPYGWQNKLFADDSGNSDVKIWYNIGSEMLLSWIPAFTKFRKCMIWLKLRIVLIILVRKQDLFNFSIKPSSHTLLNYFLCPEEQSMVLIFLRVLGVTLLHYSSSILRWRHRYSRAVSLQSVRLQTIRSNPLSTTCTTIMARA